jgi:hypothetical protein
MWWCAVPYVAMVGIFHTQFEKRRFTGITRIIQDNMLI